jgi:hypothetical protein
MTTNPATELAQVLRGAAPSTVTDWPAALALADRQALLPAVWSAAVAHRWSTALPTEVLSAISVHFAPGTQPPLLLLQQAYEANARRTVDLRAQAVRLLRQLECNSIAAVPLKGAHALLEGWWPDPSARVMRDLDILVPAHAAESARSALLADGYRDRLGQHRLARHEYAVLHHPGRAGTIELQVAPLVDRWPVLKADALLAQAPRISTTDAVIHTIAHAQLQDEAHLLRRTPLRSLHEIATLSAGARGPEIDWSRVRSAFTRIDAESALDSFLALVAHYFEAEIPGARRKRRARAIGLTTQTLIRHPASAGLYETIVFQRRQLEAERLRALHGAGSLRSLRARHVRSGIARAVTGSGLAGWIGSLAGESAGASPWSRRYRERRPPSRS